VWNRIEIQADVRRQADEPGLEQQPLAIDRNRRRVQDPDGEHDGKAEAQDAEGRRGRGIIRPEQKGEQRRRDKEGGGRNGDPKRHRAAKATEHQPAMAAAIRGEER